MRTPVTVTLSLLVLALLAGPVLAQQPAAGQPAPELDVAEWINCQPQSLADLRGKVVVLEFFAHWCGPCMAVMPNLVQHWTEWQPEGKVVIIGIHSTSRSTPSDAQRVIDRFGITFPVAFDSTTSRQYGITGIPHSYVIGVDGNVAWHGHPASGLEAAVHTAVEAWTPPRFTENNYPRQLQRACRSLLDGRIAPTVEDLQELIADEETEAEVREAAERLLAEVEEMATEQWDEIQTSDAAALYFDAWVLLEDFADNYAGFPDLAESAAELAEAYDDDEHQSSIRAGERYHEALADYDDGDLRGARRHAEYILRRYEETAYAALAQELLNRLGE